MMLSARCVASSTPSTRSSLEFRSRLGGVNLISGECGVWPLLSYACRWRGVVLSKLKEG